MMNIKFDDIDNSYKSAGIMITTNNFNGDNKVKLNNNTGNKEGIPRKKKNQHNINQIIKSRITIHLMNFLNRPNSEKMDIFKMSDKSEKEG